MGDYLDVRSTADNVGIIVPNDRRLRRGEFLAGLGHDSVRVITGKEKAPKWVESPSPLLHSKPQDLPFRSTQQSYQFFNCPHYDPSSPGAYGLPEVLVRQVEVAETRIAGTRREFYWILVRVVFPSGATSKNNPQCASFDRLWLPTLSILCISMACFRTGQPARTA